MNRACLGVDTDQIDCKTALPVPVLGCEVTSEVTVIGLIMKQLRQCLCRGA